MWHKPDEGQRTQQLLEAHGTIAAQARLSPSPSAEGETWGEGLQPGQGRITLCSPENSGDGGEPAAGSMTRGPSGSHAVS